MLAANKDSSSYLYWRGSVRRFPFLSEMVFRILAPQVPEEIEIEKPDNPDDDELPAEEVPEEDWVMALSKKIANEVAEDDEVKEVLAEKGGAVTKRASLNVLGFDTSGSEVRCIEINL